jgi:hypothetical protein
MVDTIRIKRRTTGSPGAPASLANAELAYNEVDHTLYYGEGTGGAGGTATVVVQVGGYGYFAPINSPTFTGVPAAPTATPGTTTTQLATTAFVGNAVAAATAGVSSWNTRTGAVTLTLADVTGVGGAPIASPTFTGTPAAPTPANGNNTTQLATTQYVLATRLDQLTAPAVDVPWNSHKIIGLLDPTNPQDGATKNYVDLSIQGIVAKGPCRVATTGANITLSGTQTIDGIAVVAGDRVLVKDQTTASANGIYVVAAGAWARSADANTWTALVSAYTFIEQGPINADNGYLCTVVPGGTLGTTPVTWVQFSGAGQIVAGNGLTKSGNTISAVGTAGQIAIGTGISIDPTYVGQTSITTLGAIGTGTWNGTTVAVNHGGSGATALTGYLVGNGASPFTASATIPNSAITGLGTMATQNANAIAVTGGTIDGITFDGGTF